MELTVVRRARSQRPRATASRLGTPSAWAATCISAWDGAVPLRTAQRAAGRVGPLPGVATKGTCISSTTAATHATSGRTALGAKPVLATGVSVFRVALAVNAERMAAAEVAALVRLASLACPAVA